MKSIKTINSVVNSGKCTGCMACYHICPNNAIILEEKEDGFIYPQIQMDKCTYCGVCNKKCPIVQKREAIHNTVCYAAQADDSIRINSSSGGVFSLIAQYVIRQGGIVCGAGFCDGKVKHIIADTEKGIEKLRKSKYIQSDCSSIYDEVESYIRNKKCVLFTGTPCQCAAIKSLYNETDKLIIVDILCMGVPSQALFDRYLHEEMPDSTIENIDFRDKSKYGWSQNLVLSLQKNGKLEMIDNADSPYYSAFLDAFSIRESCTECAFANKERVGDITIGDFWGIEGYDQEFSDFRGTSLILVNTKGGEKILNSIKGELKLFKDFDISIAFQNNPILKYPTMVSSKRREFLSITKEETIREKYYNLKSNKADCGIINYWWCNDNGAILTAFALQKLLQINGFSSRLINVCEENQLDIRSGGISSEFERKYLYTTNQITSQKQFEELNDSFIHFIVGSDQVFRAEWVSDRWFLDFVELSHNKIAMAASFGTEKLTVDKRRKRKIKFLLSRFNSISIRELSGVGLCQNLGVNAKFVIDPVFLIPPKYYIEIINNSNYSKENKKHIFGYFRDKTDDKNSQLHEFASQHNLDVFIADDSVPVEKFLSMLYTAEYVLTDSYHGLCFSLIFNKKFGCYYNELRGNDRFESLIQVLGINRDKFIHENESSTNAIECSEDWEKINLNISKQRKIGTEWLLSALQNPASIDEDKVKRAYWNEKIGNFIPYMVNILLHNRITNKIYFSLKHMERKVKYEK